MASIYFAISERELYQLAGFKRVLAMIRWQYAYFAVNIICLLELDIIST